MIADILYDQNIENIFFSQEKTQIMPETTLSISCLTLRMKKRDGSISSYCWMKKSGTSTGGT